MLPLAFALYLLCFYCLPLRPPMTYQWVWWAARQHFPHLVFYYHGHLIWNLAFYFEMMLWWLGFLALAGLAEWLSKRDDPEWSGLFSGFGRQSGLANGLLVVLFCALSLYCLFNNYPAHGPLSAGAAVIVTLVGIPALHSRKQKQPRSVDNLGNREQGTGNSQSQIENPRPLTPYPLPPTIDPEARPLHEDEPPPIAFEGLVQKAVQAVVPAAAGGLAFCDYQFTPPPQPDPRLPAEPERQIAFHLPQSDYLAEVAEPRPSAPDTLANRLAAAGRSDVLRRVAGLLDSPGAEPRYRVRKVIDFVDTLADEPAPDGHLRLPLECLHDHKATATEKAWLAASLLQAGGFRTALTQQQEGGTDRYSIAVADVYDPSGYLNGVIRRDETAGTVWTLPTLSGSPPASNDSPLYPLPGGAE